MDAITGGRFELVLGRDGFRDAAVGMGGAPLPRPAKAREALTEAIDIVRAFWPVSRLRSMASITSCPPSNPDHRPPTISASGSAL